MKSVTIAALSLIVALFALAGCALLGLDSNDPTPTPPPVVGQARIECLDVRNAGGTRHCPVTSAGFGLISAAHAEQLVDAGTVTRAQLIEVSQLVSNLTPSPFQGYVEARFDAGCNGATSWEILPKQAVTVAAGDQLSLSVSGACSDMPLGPRRLTATAYAADGVTVVDTAVVTFTLVD